MSRSWSLVHIELNERDLLVTSRKCKKYYPSAVDVTTHSQVRFHYPRVRMLSTWAEEHPGKRNYWNCHTFPPLASGSAGSSEATSQRS